MNKLPRGNHLGIHLSFLPIAEVGLGLRVYSLATGLPFSPPGISPVGNHQLRGGEGKGVRELGHSLHYSHNRNLKFRLNLV